MTSGTLTANVATKETKNGFHFTITLSDGTVATRSSTKMKAAVLLNATGTIQTGFTTTLSNKPATLVAKVHEIGGRLVAIDLATGRVLAQAGATRPAIKLAFEETKTAAKERAWVKFTGAPERLARQMDRDIAFWGKSHPSAPAWAAIAAAARTLDGPHLAHMFSEGARTMGDLERILERFLGVRG